MELDHILKDIDPITYPKIFFVFIYNKLSKRLIKDFKYRRPYYKRFWSKELFNYVTENLSLMLSDTALNLTEKIKVDKSKRINLYFTAVPLHAQRLNSRTYNQAALVAKTTAQYLRELIKSKTLLSYYQSAYGFDTYTVNEVIYLDKLFIRTKATENLYSKGKYARLEILKKAFLVNPNFQHRLVNENENVLIVLDDICTTGATFLELFKEIHKAKLKFDEIIFLACTGRNFD
jgi:predicted amidophosphoribosyltransferase